MGRERLAATVSRTNVSSKDRICAVLATSRFCHVPYEQVFDFYKDAFDARIEREITEGVRKRRVRWDGRVMGYLFEQAFQEFNTPFTRHDAREAITFMEWYEQCGKIHKTYFVHIKRHVFTSEGGIAMDQHTCGGVSSFGPAQRKIYRVYGR